MSRSRDRILLAVSGTVVGAALLLTACGSEQESASGPGTASEPADSTSPVVVGGPRPESPATSVPEETEPGTQQCGKISGPDGALRVLIVSGSLNCSTAMELAKEYGPKIATGEPQTVNGWKCGPSQTTGVLASCTKDDAEVTFAP